MSDTIIRCSYLPAYPDCSRRTAARLFRAEIVAAGYELREETRGVGAAIGIAVHEAARAELDEKARLGTLPPESFSGDIANDTVKEEIRLGVMYDQRITFNAADAQLQAIRMAKAYHAYVAPTIEPLVVEERFEAQVAPGIVLSGRPDIVAREPGSIHDLKAGAMFGYHAPQIGAYSLIVRAHGIDVETGCIDWVPRAPIKRAQPRPSVHQYDIGAAETAAANIVRHMADDLRVFREGDPERRVLPGDAWAFPANPASMLCGEKYCSAYGGAGPHSFCREWKAKE